MHPQGAQSFSSERAVHPKGELKADSGKKQNTQCCDNQLDDLCSSSPASQLAGAAHLCCYAVVEYVKYVPL